MRKQVEISDRFNSASETEWISTNWELEPHTRDIKPLLSLVALMTILFGGLGGALYITSAGGRWRDRMRELYAPYKAAVIEIEKLEYCNTSSCFYRKEELIKVRDEAWERLCGAENSEEYIRKLRNENLPYQSCD